MIMAEVGSVAEGLGGNVVVGGLEPSPGVEMGEGSGSPAWRPFSFPRFDDISILGFSSLPINILSLDAECSREGLLFQWDEHGAVSTTAASEVRKMAASRTDAQRILERRRPG